MVIANDKTLRDLEFDRVKHLLKGFCSSSLGVEAIDALTPLEDRGAIEQGMAEVGEAISFLEEHGRFSLHGVDDLAPLLRRAEKHAFLAGEEFLLILRTIDETRRIRAVFTTQEAFPSLRRFAERLFEAIDLAKRIHRAIDETGAVRDAASLTLKSLIAKRRTLEQRVEKKLRALIDRNPELISEAVITRRAGRLVVPIKSGAVGAMGFVVHDRSATGQTLYAEPTTLVAENNNLTTLDGEIHDERLRILRELTETFKEKGSSLLHNRAILAHLDSLFARASYAIAHHCSFPRLSCSLALRNACHPLIDQEQVVPISLSIGDRTRMAVITGPNTGGKTVTLKTLGLLTLMTQSIIPIPASPDSKIPLVSRVRTDIGDEQSISQNLSTFSAHMRNIVSILEEADAGALVLLDELGAGTDPQEGAALGLAIIEDLLQSEALVAVSTHLTPLKYFAIRHPAVKTASMEFDVETLSPTFRVIEGVPGKSNAFVIARSLGLSEDLVTRARSFLTKGEIRAEDIIEELERERQTLLKHRSRAEQELAEASKLKHTYAEKVDAFEEAKEETLSIRIRELEAFLRQSQQQVERLLREINSASTVEEAKKAYRKLADLRGELRKEEERATRVDEGATLSPDEIQVGQLVHVHSLGTDGKIVSISPRGKVTIDLQGIRVSTEAADLSLSLRPRVSPALRVSRVQHSAFRVSRVPLQLNVRGMTVAEALRELETYLDQLLLADIRSASVLHGKGTGALRDAINAYLSSCSFVSSCRLAPPREGGEGITVFELAEE